MAVTIVFVEVSCVCPDSYLELKNYIEKQKLERIRNYWVKLIKDVEDDEAF